MSQAATLHPEPCTLHIPAGMPPVHLSPSRLNDILISHEDALGAVTYAPGCLFAHQQREHRRKPEVVTDDAGLGLRFHSFARLYVEHLIRRGRWLDDPAARSIVRELCSAPPRLDARGVQELERLARIFLAGYKHLNGETHCERRLAFTFPDLIPCTPACGGQGPAAKAAATGSGTVEGGLDHYRLDPDGTSAHLLDYKSGPGAKFSAYNAYRNAQLQYYAWLLCLAYPALTVVHGTIWGVAYGPGNVAKAEWSRATLDGLVLPRVAAGYVVQEQEYLDQLRRQAAAATDNGDWTARAHVQACRYCQPDCLGCPLLKEARAKWKVESGKGESSPGGAHPDSGPCTRGAGPPSAGSAAAPQDKSESPEGK